MPTRIISRDLKARVPVLFFDQDKSVPEICSLLGVKKTLVYNCLDNHTTYGVAHNPNGRRSTGRPHHLSATDITYIEALLEQTHSIYLDEIQEKLLTQRDVDVSITTLLRTLRRLHFSRKCVSIRALERNDLVRSAYMNHIADIVPDPNMLMFMDEAAKNDRTTGRSKGWSLKGRRCVQRRAFIRGKRYSILPVLTLDGIIAHDVIEGSVNTERFLSFLEEHVVSNFDFTCCSRLILTRFLSPTLIPGRAVFLSSIIAVFTMLKKSELLWRIKRIRSHFCHSLHIILIQI
jgi:transposase